MQFFSEILNIIYQIVKFLVQINQAKIYKIFDYFLPQFRLSYHYSNIQDNLVSTLALNIGYLTYVILKYRMKDLASCKLMIPCSLINLLNQLLDSLPNLIFR